MSGEAVHTHEPVKAQAVGSMLSGAEQRSAARQLTLAMLALGLLGLGLIWRFIAPEQTGVSQLLLGAASLLVAIPVSAPAGTACGARACMASLIS